jgi:serine/threonine protein kinase
MTGGLDALVSGTVLEDRFELTERLGSGAFGVVYRARQLIFGHYLRDVALKLFKAETVTAETVHQVFADAITVIGMQDERASSQVRERLIQVYDVGLLAWEGTRVPYLAMRLVPGRRTLETLVQRYQQGGMPVNLSLRYLRELLIPLAWMHRLDPPVVHADIKPDNVLLSDQDGLVLTDFGMASRLPLKALGGAVQYQAPETLVDAGADTASDVYAVGLLWYELLTGRHAFAGVGLQAQADADPAALVAAQLAARKRPLRARDPQIPNDDERIVPVAELNEEFARHPQLAAVLERCLAYRRSERYAHAGELLAAIEGYLERGVVKPSAVAPVVASSPAGDPLETRALLADATAQLERKDAAQALILARRAAAQEPASLEAPLVELRALLALRRLDEASALCVQLRKRAPSDARGFEAQALLYEAMKKPSLAADMRARAVRLQGGGR